MDPSSGQTYYYNEQSGQSQWEPPQAAGGYGAPQQGYGAQQGMQQGGSTAAVWYVTSLLPNWPVQEGMQAGSEPCSLGRADTPTKAMHISRVQCVVQANPDGTCTLFSQGKGPTGYAQANSGGQWQFLQVGEARALADGDQISLDYKNPTSAIFTVQADGAQGGMGMQGGYGQQQGGMGMQGGYGQQQGGYGGQQGGYGQQEGGYGQQQGGYGGQQGGY